tara:strand:- start:1979 stop:2263 length:285 start_codon:yes stop_codon:yes gene_type:complete
MIEVKSTVQKNNSILARVYNQCVADIRKASVLSILINQKGEYFFWCGNRGSEANVQHMFTELMGVLASHLRDTIPSIALMTDIFFITTWAYDAN